MARAANIMARRAGKGGKPAGKDGKAGKHGKDEKAHAPKPWWAFSSGSSMQGKTDRLAAGSLQMGSFSRHLAGFSCRFTSPFFHV